MTLILDTDALIKLFRAGVLEQVARAFNCIIPESVYQEAVIRGKARFYPDAEAIERIVMASVTVEPTSVMGIPELGIGAGETGVLALANQQQEKFATVSDDHRFLAILASQGIEFLTPTALIISMARQGILTLREAREALIRLQPLVRKDAYDQAMQELSKGEAKQP
jgi:hypothetical protein